MRPNKTYVLVAHFQPVSIWPDTGMGESKGSHLLSPFFLFLLIANTPIASSAYKYPFG